MAQSDVPDIVIQRLPLYLRYLTLLAQQGLKVVSSKDLGAGVGISAAQIRKDLSRFGEFGKQGLGYEVAFLRDHLMRILQTDRDWPLALVGAGSLGRAVIHYQGFQRWRYHVVAVFDRDPAKIGQPVYGLTVLPMEEMARVIGEKQIAVAILAVPAAEAQQVAGELVACGIRAILCYAPVHLTLPPKVRVAYIDPVTALQGMTYHL